MTHDDSNSKYAPRLSLPELDLVDPDGTPPVPGYRNYRVYCDESGIHGARYLAFGGLFMAHERRGDFTALVQGLRDEYGFHHEIKWTKVSMHHIEFFEALVREFFRRPWLLFHCLVVERPYVDMEHHKDFDEVKRKFFALFLQGRLKFLNGSAKTKAYHVIVDPLPSRYAKADEAAHKIVNHTLKRDIGSPLVTKLVTRDSKDAVGIQVADLLLGAVLAGWQGEITAPGKLRLMRYVASHLGWPDTASDTYPHEAKFNIWNFHDPRDQRRTKTRTVRLLVPCSVIVTKS